MQLSNAVQFTHALKTPRIASFRQPPAEVRERANRDMFIVISRAANPLPDQTSEAMRVPIPQYRSSLLVDIVKQRNPLAHGTVVAGMHNADFRCTRSYVAALSLTPRKPSTGNETGKAGRLRTARRVALLSLHTTFDRLPPRRPRHRRDRVVLIFQFDMRVDLHGQVNVAVAGQRLCQLRPDAAPRQI